MHAIRILKRSESESENALSLHFYLLRPRKIGEDGREFSLSLLSGVRSGVAIGRSSRNASCVASSKLLMWSSLSIKDIHIYKRHVITKSGYKFTISSSTYIKDICCKVLNYFLNKEMFSSVFFFFNAFDLFRGLRKSARE